MSKHIIQAINFNINNSDLPLISNLNWVVDESEWIEIIGENNSCKTTLLNAIYGQLNESSGQFYVLDFSMTPIAKNDLSSLRRKLGYVKQDLHLLGSKTLRANLAMALNAADRIMDQNFEEIIANILERFSLKDYLKKEVRDLSYSQQQMTAMARALIHRPKLLLLDQSLDYLDHSNRLKVIEIIQEYRDSERMTVVSTSLIGLASIISNSKRYLIGDKTLQVLS